MKLITLNVWGGKIYQPLINFLKKQANQIDIFCFQEIITTPTDIKTDRGWRINILSEIKNILPDYQMYFAPIQENKLDDWMNFSTTLGQATFVKNSIQVNKQGDVFVHRRFNSFIKEEESMGRSLQYLELKQDNRQYTICNFHGLCDSGPKTDTAARINQSRKIKQFLNQIKGPKLICGDFNLLPETESFRIIKEGLTDLIEKYNISSTRSSYFHYEAKFADYILTSPNIKINDFKVFPEEISDHLALYLDFD